MECRFCNIETADAQRILEVRERCVIMFSNPRLMRGHLLVVPKRHVEHLSELDSDERKELFDTAIEYQERIKKNIAPGCDLKQHNRPFLPENDLKVDHVHIHLQPRSFDDELYTKAQIHERTLFKSPTEEEILKIKNLLG
ncbi:HIT family protein [Candidatus Parcubacteria bacterium]|nr:HIT family protein [Candidatus Parcubacteria bacterium]